MAQKSGEQDGKKLVGKNANTYPVYKRQTSPNYKRFSVDNLNEAQIRIFFFLNFNSLPIDKMLDLSKFKAFADDKIIETQKLEFTLGRIENIVGKGENAGYQHFLLFPQCFTKLSS